MKQVNEMADRNEDQGHDTGQTSQNANNLDAGREMQKQKLEKQSFASLFKDNRAPVEASQLKYIAPPMGEVVIGVDEIDSVEKSFGFCLVGYVMGPRPSPFAVLNFVKRWGGNVKFLFKDHGWIKFQFATEIERDSVLNGGPYVISGRQLFLKKMPSCFLFSKEDMVFLPSWVQIFGLPADCWTAPALSKIASVVGKSIHTDQLTISKKGLTYARVLVEIDAKKPRVWDYAVKLPTGKTTVVKFKYELEPKFCNNCNSLGHVTELCGVDTRKKRHTQQMNQNETETSSATAAETEASSATAAGKIHEATILEEPCKTSKDEPQCSNTKEKITPANAASDQQATARTGANRNLGKEVENNLPMYGEQQQDDFSDDDLLSGDETERPALHAEDFDLNSDDLDDILSRVRTQDKEEWKTVSKKNRRIKNKIRSETHYSKADSGTSSMETEYVALDPISKQPLKEEQPRVFKKNTDEARRPKTAFGSQ